MIYYKNNNVRWDGQGWYILFKGTPDWMSQWRKAKSLEQLDAAAFKGQGTAYLTHSTVTRLQEDE